MTELQQIFNELFYCAASYGWTDEVEKMFSNFYDFDVEPEEEPTWDALLTIMRILYLEYHSPEDISNTTYFNTFLLIDEEVHALDELDEAYVREAIHAKETWKAINKAFNDIYNNN